MKFNFLNYILTLVVFTSIISCTETTSSNSGNNTEIKEEGTTMTEVVSSTQPAFNVSLQKVTTPLPTGFPFLHSAAYAQQGNEVLFIGGRNAGFHGISQEQEPFKTTKANSSIWVVDFENYTYSELPLGTSYPDLIQFKASNFLSYQDNDTLYIAGGYGAQNQSATESNTTHGQIFAIQVSKMIDEVKKGAGGNPRNAIIKVTQNPFVQVAGGEMIKANDIIYLFFGQNYEGEYILSREGIYTNAVRKFKWNNASITDTASIIASNLRRRDLNVMQVEQSGAPFFVGYGGVFNKNDGGFLKPIYVSTENGDLVARVNEDLIQKTNNYKAAVASIYDPNQEINTHVILGGIGQFQYDQQTGQWEEGDNGAPLPFVSSITQMIWKNGYQTQYIQLPPSAPEMPELLGSNAFFIPKPSLFYRQGIIDYSKLGTEQISIGWFFGGIKSQAPTSSMIYPTSINNTIYEVIISKLSN